MKEVYYKHKKFVLDPRRDICLFRTPGHFSSTQDLYFCLDESKTLELFYLATLESSGKGTLEISKNDDAFEAITKTQAESWIAHKRNLGLGAENLERVTLLNEKMGFAF